MKKVLYSASLFLSILYILNPTLGIFELLPDNLPWFGNIDEAAATTLAIWSAKKLGWFPNFLESKNNKNQKKEDTTQQ